jgi:hypothetical protein
LLTLHATGILQEAAYRFQAGASFMVLRAGRRNEMRFDTV